MEKKTTVPKHKKKTCICNESAYFKTKYVLPQLRRLCRANKKKRNEMLGNVDKCFLKFLGECSEAVLKKFISLPNNCYSKLKKHLDTLLFLAEPNSLKRKRERLINQQGGFLFSIILPALASGVISLVSQVIAKKLTK
jgi:hypothetical protein